MANEMAKRVFKREALRRIFSKARFFSLLFGAGIAGVYFLTGGNIFASVGFTLTTYVLFRYGEIKGYIKKW